MNVPWIPGSPGELLHIAAQLDRFWADAKRLGYTKPSLADELALLERHYAALESGGD